MLGQQPAFNRSTAKLFNWNFHSLEVVFRWRDTHLQVSDKLFRFDQIEVNDFEILLIDVTFYLYHVQKLALNVLIKNIKKIQSGSGLDLCVYFMIGATRRIKIYIAERQVSVETAWLIVSGPRSTRQGSLLGGADPGIQ